MVPSTALVDKDLVTELKKKKRKEKFKQKKVASAADSRKSTKREYSQRKRNLQFKQRLEAKANVEASVSSDCEKYKYIGKLNQVPSHTVVPSGDLQDPSKYQLEVVID